MIVDQVANTEDYWFTSNMIELKHHATSNQAAKVNTWQCLEYLMEMAGSKKILDDKFIKNDKDLRWQMESTDVPVDFWFLYLAS